MIYAHALVTERYRRSAAAFFAKQKIVKVRKSVPFFAKGEKFRRRLNALRPADFPQTGRRGRMKYPAARFDLCTCFWCTNQCRFSPKAKNPEPALRIPLGKLCSATHLKLCFKWVPAIPEPFRAKLEFF